MAARLPLFDALEPLIRDDGLLKLRQQKEEFRHMIERERKSKREHDRDPEVFE